MTYPDPTFYQRFYHAARNAGPPPDPEKLKKQNSGDEEGTWLAREKQKCKRSYLPCGAVFLTVLIMGIGIGALVQLLGIGGARGGEMVRIIHGWLAS
ncbi:hypothetical protein B9Z19DRAFT_1149644 [Tuber borchii]|uniref:Uncharacterized protein n=1 Tax=Tuber borchii TaxID=42251 RepID=A0A2T7A5N0_TUBBO|nr:hypothetical protein B9Z19DRAFT_1149644 [Tuber borchii]